MKNLTQVVQSFSIRSKENRRSKNKQWMFEQVQFTTVNDGQTRTQQQIKVQLPQSIEQKKIQGGFVSHWSCGSPSPTTKTPSTPPQQQHHHQTVTPTKSPTTGQFFPTSPMTNTTSSPRVTMTTPTSPPTYPPVQHHHIHQSDTSSNSVNNNNFVSNPDLSQQQRNQRQQQEEHLYQSMYLTLTGKYNKTTSNGCSNKIQKRSNSSNRTRVAITIRDLLN